MGSDPKLLRSADETDFTEARLPDRERQLANLRRAVSIPVLLKSRVLREQTTGERKDSPTPICSSTKSGNGSRGSLKPASGNIGRDGNSCHRLPGVVFWTDE